ncbi:MAG: hypothetical protein ACTS4W_01740 [Candidatus Hodgkinia cicadicola]
MQLWQTNVRWICSFALLNFKWNNNNARGINESLQLWLQMVWFNWTSLEGAAMWVKG